MSLWCGSAANLVVSGDAAFTTPASISTDLRVHVEGLDARDTWPPLLRPGVLAGVDGYHCWEERLRTDLLGPVTRGERRLGDALRAALRWTDRLRTWRVADGAFPAFVQELPVGGPSRQGEPPRDGGITQHGASAPLRAGALDLLLNDLMSRVPTGWRAEAWPAGLTGADTRSAPTPVVLSRAYVEATLARYLAVRLTGSWVAYQGQGLRSVLASLVSAAGLAALALARCSTPSGADGPGDSGAGAWGRLRTAGGPGRADLVTALRAADWLLLHLLDRQVWADWCSGVETDRGSDRLVTLVCAVDDALDGLYARPRATR